MMGRLLAVTVLVMIGLVGLIAAQPTDYVISRSIRVNAPASAPFALVNDFHRWESWSPWARLDPNQTFTFEGVDAGKGAKLYWSGNNKVGEGWIEITDSNPDTLIQTRLDFLRPMTSTSYADFSFKRMSDHTLVTWSMHGKNDFIGKAIDLLMNCEKMVGDQFEQGLANIKAVAEANPDIKSVAEQIDAE